jgi:hypothetical protein
VTGTITSTRKPAAPFFFQTPDGARLFGVWRAPADEPRAVWVICPPFAEEEKSAHRTLVELCETRDEHAVKPLCFWLSRHRR